MNEELLLPAEEFLESLKEDSDQQQDPEAAYDPYEPVQLPKNLLRLWSKLLSMLSDLGAMPEVVRALVHQCEASRKLKEAGLARAWVERICADCQADFIELERPARGKKQRGKNREPAATPVKKKSNGSHGAEILTKEQVASSASEFNALVSDLLLESPSEARLQLLPSLLRLRTPTVTAKQESQLAHLMEACLGKKAAGGGDLGGEKVFTLADVTVDNAARNAEDGERDEDEDETEEAIESPWALCLNQEELRSMHLGAGLCLPTPVSSEGDSEEDSEVVDVSLHSDFYPALSDPEPFLKLWMEPGANEDGAAEEEEASGLSDAAAFSAAEDDKDKEKSLPAFYRTRVVEKEDRREPRAGGSARKRRRRN